MPGTKELQQNKNKIRRLAKKNDLSSTQALIFYNNSGHYVNCLLRNKECGTVKHAVVTE